MVFSLFILGFGGFGGQQPGLPLGYPIKAPKLPGKLVFKGNRKNKRFSFCDQNLDVVPAYRFADQSHWKPVDGV